MILGANLSGDLTVQVFLLELKLYFLWPSYKVPQVLSGQPETYFLQSTLCYISAQICETQDLVF